MIIKKNINKIFYLFLFTHLFLWTTIPTVSNINLPLDTIEALAWGSNLDWGFNKHPPLSAFFTEIFFSLFGSQDWVYYFLSQLFVIVSFYFVFKLSYEFLNDFKSTSFIFEFKLMIKKGLNFKNPLLSRDNFWSLKYRLLISRLSVL